MTKKTSSTSPKTTRRTGAKRSPNRLQTLVESVPMGLFTADADGVITHTNCAFEALLGYGPGELRGATLEAVFPDGLPLYNAVDRAGGEGTAGAKHKRGTIRLLHASVATLKGGAISCAIRDASVRHRLAAERERYKSELERHRSETALLNEMSSFLQHAVNEDEALAIMTSFGSRLFSEASVGIYLLPPSGNELELRASWNGFVSAGWNRFENKKRILPNDCWALRRSQTHKSGPSTPAICNHLDDACGNDGVRATCIPMSAHGQWLGFVTVLPDPGCAEEERRHSESMAKSITDQLGLALSNLQLRTKLRSLSIRDPLTGLFNRRYLEETAERELHRAVRHSTSVGVLMVDVDHFKSFNDRHGHQYADGVLQTVATTLQSGVRQEDVACRYGGEEFVVLLPDATLEGATRRADELREAVHRNTNTQVSCSIGVASYPEHGATLQSLLKHADDALYRAKENGRNRVEVAPVGKPGLKAGDETVVDLQSVS